MTDVLCPTLVYHKSLGSNHTREHSRIHQDYGQIVLLAHWLQSARALFYRLHKDRLVLCFLASCNKSVAQYLQQRIVACVLSRIRECACQDHLLICYSLRLHPTTLHRKDEESDCNNTDKVV